MPSLFEIGILITEFSVSWIRGFGSRLLVRQGFLGAKAGHSDQRFCRWKLLFYQQPCAKAKEFGEAEFWDGLPVFLWRNLGLAFS